MADENRTLNDNQQPSEKHPVLEDATTLTGKRKRHHPALIWLISIVCVAALCGAGYLASKTEAPADDAQVEATEAPDYTTQLLSHSSDEIKSVTVNYNGQTYTVLNNGDDGLAIDGYDNFKLNTDTAKSLITRGTTLITQSTVAENCTDLAQYGLDNPTSTFTYEYTDGTTTTLELGNKSPMTYYYLKLAGDNTVYSVYSSVATTMMTTLESLHTVEMPATLDGSSMTYVKLERPNSANSATPVSANGEGGELISDMMGLDGMGKVGDTASLATAAPETAAAEEPAAATDAPAADAAATAADAAATAEATDAPADDTAAEPVSADAADDMTVIEITTRADDDAGLGVSSFKMVEPFEYDVDTEALSTLCENVAAITIDSYVGNVSEAGNPYGMDNPIRLQGKDANDADITFLIGNKADDTNTYISVDDTGDVYLTKSSTVEFARTLTVAGIVERFANIINISKVDSLDINTPDGDYELKIERIPELDEDGNVKQNDKGDDIINEVYYFGGEETDSDSFKKLYQQVIGVLVNGVTDDYAIDGNPVVTVTYHLNVEPGEVKIEYIEYDRDNYAVRRDGHTYFFINKNKVATMVTALEQYNQQ